MDSVRSEEIRKKTMPAFPTITPSSPARSDTLHRSFTDDGCDQPETNHNSHHDSLHSPMHGSLHLGSSSSHYERISKNDHQVIAETETSTDTETIIVEEGPSISDILDCNNTRTVCGGRVMSSQSSVDSGSLPVSPTPSMNHSVSSHSTHTSTSASQSHNTHQSGWTLETKLSRSQERRKRLEGRFQRERSKRRSMENDRNRVIKFVKALLLGLEAKENNNSNSDSSQRTITSIREFVSQHERILSSQQGQSDWGGSSSHDDFEDYDYDDVTTFFLPAPKPEEEERIKTDNARKLRELLENQEGQEQGEYSDDSSYDTCEAEDSFSELPVKFRSIEELESYCREKSNENDDDATEDSDEGELQKYKEELESLELRFELSTEEHLAEIDSMERRFRDESLKREDLLERALTYAEHLEEVGRNKSEDISSKQKDLELLAHQHFRKVEALRRERHEELLKQKEKVSQECAVEHAKELKNLKKLFEDERANQIKESNLRHVEDLKELKKQYGNHLENLAKAHEMEMHAQKQEQLLDDSQKTKIQNLENSKLLQALQDRDATIENLRTEGIRKNKELQKARQTTMAHKSIILSLEKQRKNKGKELQKARDMAAASELASSANKIRQLQEDVQERDARIGDLEEIVLESKKKAGAQSNDNLQMNAKLQEQLQERIFEIATLRNEHAKAMEMVERSSSNNALELQRLKKQLNDNEDHHIQEVKTMLREKESALDNLELRYSKEMRKAQIAFDETKETHTRHVASMIIDMDDLKEKYANKVNELVSKMNAMQIETLPKPTSTIRSSYHRRTIDRDFDVNQHAAKGKKKRTVSTSWFGPTKTVSPDLDSTSPTVSTSCSSSANDLATDDRSINTFESRKCLPPRSNEKWNMKDSKYCKGSIVSSSGSSDSSRRRKTLKNKLPPSLLTLVGGIRQSAINR